MYSDKGLYYDKGRPAAARSVQQFEIQFLYRVLQGGFLPDQLAKTPLPDPFLGDAPAPVLPGDDPQLHPPAHHVRECLSEAGPMTLVEPLEDEFRHPHEDPGSIPRLHVPTAQEIDRAPGELTADGVHGPCPSFLEVPGRR